MSRLIRKMSQAMGVLLLLSTVFLIVSISSYTQDDPAGNYYVSHGPPTVRNYGGVAGALLADWALQALGCTVTLLAVVGLFSAWYLAQARLGAALAVGWRGVCCLLAVSAGVYLAWSRDPLWGTATLAGGISGQWVAESLVVHLQRPGAYGILGMLIIGMLGLGVEHPRLAALWRVMRRAATGPRTSDEQMPSEASLPEELASEASEAEERPRRRRRVRSMPLPAAEARPHTEETPEASAPPVPDAETAPLPVAVVGPRNRRRALAVPQLPPTALGTPPPVSDALPESVRQTPPPRRVPVPVRPPAAPPVALPAAVVPTPSVPPPVPRVLEPQRSGGVTLPSLDLLDRSTVPQWTRKPDEWDGQARFLEQKLREFGVEGEVVQVLPGPVITLYAFAPAPGVKVSKIVHLQDDLALVMEAMSVRVVAPIPGKAAVGIEIPHQRRETVCLRDLLESTALQASTSKLSVPLGKDTLGHPVVTDLALIPHLLIAGATGSGKSVGLNSVICSLLFRATPAEVKLIMIDPKMLEFSVYDGIPHLLVPVVTEPKQAAVVLRRVVEEMGRRYRLLAAHGVRHIAQYNQQVVAVQTQPGASQPPGQAEPLPYLVVVIDELADLMMVSAREVEDALMRLAQMARAAGIHLIVATQRPSVDVLTGVIKANFPARLSFQVTSKVDSRTILDANGAETLLGRGDMLFQAPGTSKPQRIHGAYVSEAEIQRLVQAWKATAQTSYDATFLQPESGMPSETDAEYDDKYPEARALVLTTGQASISMLQRRLRVGYNRAARMIEMMEQEGVVGPPDGMKAREVFGQHPYEAP